MCVFRFVMEYHFSNMIGMFCVDMQNILQLISIIEFNNKFYKLLYFIRINTINYYILSCNVESLYLNIYIWCHPPGGEKYVFLFRLPLSKLFVIY